jgi:hypothetical protein
MTHKSRNYIIQYFGIVQYNFGEKLNLEDFQFDKILNYEYTKFDWKSSKYGIIKNCNTIKKKHEINECQDTKDAMSHLFKEINLFLKINYDLTFDSQFKIIDASSSSNYNLELNINNFKSKGRTDLIISSIYVEDALQFNYCNIQLKAVTKYKNNDCETAISFSSKADNSTAQSIAELLGSIQKSNYPLIQFTTDLDTSFHVMFLTEKKNQLILNKYDLSGTKAIATIALWLYYFCPHFSIKNREFLKPKTNDLILLGETKSAHERIKEKIIANNLINDEIQLETEEIYLETEDSTEKCQKWVNSLCL